MRHFREAGIEIDDAIEVLAGLHPWATLSPGSLTTWTRGLLLNGDSVELWRVWTGLTPRKRLAAFPRGELRVVSHGRLYDKLELGSRYRFRIRRRDRPIIDRWLGRTP